MLFSWFIGLYVVTAIFMFIVAVLDNDESIFFMGLVPVINFILVFVIICMSIMEKIANERGKKDKEEELLRQGIYQVIIDEITYTIYENELYGKPKEKG